MGRRVLFTLARLPGAAVPSAPPPGSPYFAKTSLTLARERRRKGSMACGRPLVLDVGPTPPPSPTAAHVNSRLAAMGENRGGASKKKKKKKRTPDAEPRCATRKGADPPDGAEDGTPSSRRRTEATVALEPADSGTERTGADGRSLRASAEGAPPGSRSPYGSNPDVALEGRYHASRILLCAPEQLQAQNDLLRRMVERAQRDATLARFERDLSPRRPDDEAREGREKERPAVADVVASVDHVQIPPIAGDFPHRIHAYRGSVDDKTRKRGRAAPSLNPSLTLDTTPPRSEPCGESIAESANRVPSTANVLIERKIATLSGRFQVCVDDGDVRKVVDVPASVFGANGIELRIAISNESTGCIYTHDKFPGMEACEKYLIWADGADTRGTFVVPPTASKWEVRFRFPWISRDRKDRQQWRLIFEPNDETLRTRYPNLRWHTDPFRCSSRDLNGPNGPSMLVPPIAAFD